MSLLLFDSFEATATVALEPDLPLTGYAALVAQVDLVARRLLGGIPVIYQPATGSPVTVTGIFDDSFLLAKGSANAGVETVTPAVFLQLADLPIDPELDDPTLTIGGVSYRVTERKSADFGSIVLALRRLPA